MSAKTFYTQVLEANAQQLAHTPQDLASAPRITFHCVESVDLNALFREVLFVDPESTAYSPDPRGENFVRVVPEYADQPAADAATVDDKGVDTVASKGSHVALRLVNKLMNQSMHLDPNNTSSSMTAGNETSGFSVPSVNSTTNHSDAKLDLAEFLQVMVALSVLAQNNVVTDSSAAVLALAGLNDREVVNVHKLKADLDLRGDSAANDSNDGSKLLNALIRSANKPQTLFDNNNVSDIEGVGSQVNWMKNLVYSIIQQSATTSTGYGGDETDERYRAIKRSGLSDNERWLQMCLKSGDKLCLVFKPKINGSAVQQGGEDITVGFCITQSAAAITAPLGWAPSSP